MADYEDALAEGLAALSQFFVNDGTLTETLHKVAVLSVTTCSADLAGITMLVDGKPSTGVFTDPEAIEIDEAQYSSGSGPCLDAYRLQTICHIPSTASDATWQVFSRKALEHGIVTTLSLPLSARGEALGALNLYSRTSGAFDEEVIQAQAMTFAHQASIVLANAQVYWDAHQLNENLSQALRTRSTIDQAIGIVLSGGGRSPEEAFDVLVRASQRENRKLREIAEALVQRAIDRGQPEAAPS
jgi:GAF domain-containing protein